MASAVAEKEKKFVDQDVFKADAETYHVLQAMVEATKEQLKDLNRAMSSEGSKLQQLLHDQAEAKRTLEKELANRRVEFDRELEGERLKLHQLRAELEQVQRDMDEQKREAQHLISQGEAIRAERQQLVDLSVEMERQRVQFTSDKEIAERTILQAAEDRAASAQLVETLKQRETDVENRLREVETREGLLAAKEAAFATREQQLQLIKQEIDPKLEALTAKQDALKEQEVRIEVLQREAQEQQGANEQRAANLDGKQAQLEAQLQHCVETEARLKAWELDLQRRGGLPSEPVSTVPEANPPDAP